jgi:phosphatidylglycerol:prolipoprotein diacylglycerol transferase
LIVFPAGILGARLWFVLSRWDFYGSNLVEILKLWNGGLAIQGGVMGGVIAGVIFHKVKKLKFPLLKLFDIAIPNILIAQSIGRWGNFFNQEVYGACVSRNTLNFIPNFILNNMEVCDIGEVAQPLFLYESIINFIGFILISIIIRRFVKIIIDGELTALYLIWYGLVRLIMEPLRNEMYIMRVFGNLSLSITTSVLFIITGVALILYLRLKPYFKVKQGGR